MNSKALYCKSCDAEVTPSAKFCSRCGKKVDAYPPTRAKPRSGQRVDWRPILVSCVLVVLLISILIPTMRRARQLAVEADALAKQQASELASMPASWKTVYSLVNQVESQSERLQTLRKLVAEKADTLDTLTAEQVSFFTDSISLHKREVVELLSRFTK